MRDRAQGPRRATSVDSYLRQTRAVAVIAVLALIAGIASDDINSNFWMRHSLLAGVVASVIVVMLSLAIINEAIERRSRRRWSVLAQYIMFELVRNARMVWFGILEVAGLLPAEMTTEPALDAGALVVKDTPRLTRALRDVLIVADARRRLQAEIAFLAGHADEVLGRWAAVMLNAEMYAEIVDRHVELTGDLAWIAAALDNSDPPDEIRTRRRSRSSPAIQIESDLSPEWLADRIVVITQLAEDLDRGTLAIALRVVPVEWWQQRLGAEAPHRPSG